MFLLNMTFGCPVSFVWPRALISIKTKTCTPFWKAFFENNSASRFGCVFVEHIQDALRTLRDDGNRDDFVGWKKNGAMLLMCEFVVLNRMLGFGEVI